MMARALSICSVVLIMMISACHPVPGPDKTIAGAVLGAGWGAGAGAIVGNQINASPQGIAVGAGFGAVNGILLGAGLDIAEGTEQTHQRELDALKVRVAANHRSLMQLEQALDDRDQRLQNTQTSTQVFFDARQTSLKIGATKQLERFVNLIKRNPYVGRVEVHGHSFDTDAIEENESISEARARAVATFLSGQGVSSDRIDIFSHGNKRPLADNTTQGGRELNRRVEVVLVR